MPAYRYAMEGSAAGGQTWLVQGEVDVVSFAEALKEAHSGAFKELTGGRAVYGESGKGCSGPYTIMRLTIERMEGA